MAGRVGSGRSGNEKLSVFLERNREKQRAPDDASSVASSTRGGRDSFTWQTVETGRLGTLEYCMKFRDRLGKTCSPWHNIPLYTRRGHVHVVCKTPKRSWAHFAVAQDEPFTPLRLAERGGSPEHYGSNCPWNLTMLPQTWANPEQLNLDYIGLRYDGLPLELIEIGRKARRRGQVYSVKVLGAFAVVNHELTQLSWKLVGIATVDKRAKKVEDVKDVHCLMPRVLEEIREWLRSANCTAPGDKECVFGLNERAADRFLASALVAQAYLSWQAFARRTKPQEPAFLAPEENEIVTDVQSGSSVGGSSSDMDAMSLTTLDDEPLGPGAIPLIDPNAKLIIRARAAATASVMARRGSDDEGSGGDSGPESPGARSSVSVSCSRRELMRYLFSTDTRLSRPAFIQFLSSDAAEHSEAREARGMLAASGPSSGMLQGLSRVEERPDEEAELATPRTPPAAQQGQVVGNSAQSEGGKARRAREKGEERPGADMASSSTFAAAASAAAAMMAAGGKGGGGGRHPGTSRQPKVGSVRSKSGKSKGREDGGEGRKSGRSAVSPLVSSKSFPSTDSSTTSSSLAAAVAVSSPASPLPSHPSALSATRRPELSKSSSSSVLTGTPSARSSPAPVLLVRGRRVVWTPPVRRGGVTPLAHVTASSS